MLKKDFEEDDPFVLVGKGFPSPEGYDALGTMARCFVEEYAMLGYTEEFVLRMFRNPRFQGPHGAYVAKGEPFVRGLIRDVYGSGAGRGRTDG